MNKEETAPHWRDKPILPYYCEGCGETTSRGCTESHRHDAWLGCLDSDDIRKCRICNSYLHKECSKDGLDYWIHRQRGDIE